MVDPTGGSPLPADFHITISLDTNLVGVADASGVTFTGPFAGQIEIGSLVVPIFPVGSVQYLTGPGEFVGTQFDITFEVFSSSISSDTLHLSPIQLTNTIGSGNYYGGELVAEGPNGLAVFGSIKQFSATVVPDTGSTAVLFSFAVVVLFAGSSVLAQASKGTMRLR